MHAISRRRFLTLISGSIALSALAGCAPAPPSPELSTASPGPGTPAASSSLSAILRNTDTPGFYVRYYQPFQQVDPARWTLSVEGLVKKPVRFTAADLQSLPLISQVSRMKCVECWSAPAKWEGFRLAALAQQVEPQPEATWVHFRCADGYYESLQVEELLRDRVLFVYRMNGGPLSGPYGAPLRLIVPFKYGYKGPKAITSLAFAREELRGYWPTVGAYSTRGNIEAGYDHPLDLSDTRQITGDEIKYPDGMESGR